MNRNIEVITEPFREEEIYYPIDELSYIEENTNSIYFPIFASLNIKQTEKQKCPA